MYTLNFLACAIGKVYEEFIPPFIFFALKSNPNSFVEAVVVNRDEFMKTYGEILEEIKKECGDHFLVREFSRSLNHHIPNTYRFFEVPQIRAEYTYIADIDIMFMDNIVQIYLQKWPNTNYPYNNMVRKDSTRLTGVHFVKTDKYYCKELLEQQEVFYKGCRENDEVILYKICDTVFGNPDLEFAWRPILGIHFSPNRGPNKQIKLVTTKGYHDIFIHLYTINSELKEHVTFKGLYNQLLNDFIIN